MLARDKLFDPLDDLSPIYSRRVRHAVSIIREFYDPKAIFLFGSVAKGLCTETSDIDLLARIPNASGRRTGRGQSFHSVMADGFPRVDLVIFNDAEVAHHLANPKSFLSSVMVSARALYLADRNREPLLTKASVPCTSEVNT